MAEVTQISADLSRCQTQRPTQPLRGDGLSSSRLNLFEMAKVQGEAISSRPGDRWLFGGFSSFSHFFGAAGWWSLRLPRFDESPALSSIEPTALR